MKIVRHDESRLKLKAAQRERLLKLSKDRKASRKDREWAKRQLTEISEPIPMRPVGYFKVEKDDPMIALANRSHLGSRPA